MSKSEDISSRSGETSGDGAFYSIEMVEKITHISRDRIVLYYHHGLVSPAQKAPDEEKLVFDDVAIHKLRRIAFLLSEYGINPEGLKAFASLINEVERLREEVRFLRER